MRVGVLGTLVWDRIHARDVRREPIEEWGGIAYALGALSAAAPAEWEIVPIIRVGADLEHEARRFLASVPRLQVGAAVRVVPEPNNRVELRYQDNVKRVERLTGGVSPWSWPELEPLVADLDALYVNFISGFEMELETTQRLRLRFRGPMYADLHSLLLGVRPDGVRVPRHLDDWREWVRCFDVVQVNEDELGWLAGEWGDPWHFAADVVGDDLRLLLVTLGPRGAAYVRSPAFAGRPLEWRRESIGLTRPLAVPGAAQSERIAPDPAAPPEGDPTGCGDVWGATCFARLLAGDDVVDAMRAANRAAARNLAHRGASGLHLHLLGRIGR